MVIRANLVVYGDVQGVNYRWAVQQAAKELGLKGWVKNLPDGNVEVMCESETEKAYREFLKSIEKSEGGIKVERVEVVNFEKNVEPSFDYFNIEY